jgi:hypothetical protein
VAVAGRLVDRDADFGPQVETQLALGTLYHDRALAVLRDGDARGERDRLFSDARHDQ